MQVLRCAFRNLARLPGFTSVAIATLGLGIGLSASSFSMASLVFNDAMPGMHDSALWHLGFTIVVLAATSLLACRLSARSATRMALSTIRLTP